MASAIINTKTLENPSRNPFALIWKFALKYFERVDRVCSYMSAHLKPLKAKLQNLVSVIQNNLLIISRRVRAWNIAGVASDSSAPPDGMVAQFLLCFSNPSFPSTFVGYLDGDVVG